MATQRLQAKLTPAPSDAGETAIRFELANRSQRNLVFLRWHTPLEGLANKVFRVTAPDGSEVPYRGVMAKRGRPRRSDYVTIPAGGSVAAEVDLAEGYDLSDVGSYSVELLSPKVSQVLTEGERLAKSPDELERIELPANATTIRVDEPRPHPGTPRPRRGAAAAGDLVTPTLAKNVSFTGCTNTRQTTITNADGTATTNGRLAANYLSELTTTAEREANELYKEWFGTYTASRFSAVMSNFEEIASTFEDDDITYNCSGPACQSSWIAYVTPGGALEIFLCSGYWSAGTTGVDTQWGTLIHEMSHEVAGTSDNQYGQSACRQLAIDDPDQAIDNADSYEYFTETLLQTVAEGCIALNEVFESIGASGKALAKRTRTAFGRGRR